MGVAAMRKKLSQASSRFKKPNNKKPGKKWVAGVTTDSTHPPEGLFTKDAATIARSLASKKVSPKGPGSGMRMLNYFINRGGHNLSASRRRELEKAKKLLSQRIQNKKPV
jgi:tRNA(adenine34) deaminase